MTQVTFRKVRYRLRDMVDHPDGMRASDALTRAEANLARTAGRRLDEIDAGLEELHVLIGHGARERPSDEALQRIRKRANELMGYCLHAPLPSLAKVLGKLCGMAETLLHSRYWVPGALDPAMELAALCRRGGVPEDHVLMLLDGLDSCIRQYRAHEHDGL